MRVHACARLHPSILYWACPQPTPFGTPPCLLSQASWLRDPLTGP